MSNDLIGKHFGHYYLLEKLGEDNMAVVYKAVDTRLAMFEAVRVILPHQELSKQVLARFEREARILAKLSHPNILQIFDYGVYENHPYLVMDYISERTLKDWLKDKSIPWQISAQILAPVAWALDAAHKHGVIHGDIKPANILMLNDRDPVIFDFGVSKLIADSSEASNMMMGTPLYMAPEQAVGMADQKSDIYALGVIFFQMVTGRLPYDADTPMGVILKKSTEPLPRPSLYVQDLPVNVENILLKALASDPRFRYQNMGEFASALEGLISKGDTSYTLVTIDRTKDSMNAITPIPPEGGNSDRKDSRGNKYFRLSLAHPKSLSKRFESLFLCHIYLPEYRSRVTKNIKSELQDQEIREYIGQSTIRIGQKVRIKLFSPEINFSDSVIKMIDSPINKATFLGTPKDTCEPGSHIVLMSISDVEVDETIETLTITVRVADFAFDHISRPLLSRTSVIFLGLGSFAMFTLTLLEQIDKTLGLTFGTAAGVLATAVYANFYSVYQLIRPNTP